MTPWTLYVLVMSTSLSVTSNTMGFENRKLCEDAQKVLVAQMLRMVPQPQFQTTCMQSKQEVEQ